MSSVNENVKKLKVKLKDNSISPTTGKFLYLDGNELSTEISTSKIPVTIALSEIDEDGCVFISKEMSYTFNQKEGRVMSYELSPPSENKDKI